MPFLVDYARPLQSLTHVFVAWKAFLFIVALGSGVGPAYDTSSTLLSNQTSHHESAFDLATRLTRWDAIYFVQASRRGYLFEQEWAFASGLPTIISFLANVLRIFGVQQHGGALEPTIGIIVVNISHLLSALVLYKLGLAVSRSQRICLAAAVLHILSPAGLFLSAPYSEASYALLSFLGYLFFAKAVLSDGRTFAHDVSLVASGLWFAFAVNFRSNGTLNGVLFAVELLREMSRPPTANSVRRRLALIAGGSAIAIGFAAPQIVAYRTYCYDVVGSGSRPWCAKWLPSIYTFVQEHYWNVGFLRYWTLPNIPLFLLATPMLYILAKSGINFFVEPYLLNEGDKGALASENLGWFLRSMALPQLILTALATTTYHVQIITRISSGYPLWYLWLASLLSRDKTSNTGKNIVVFMIMYASIQGALFASFLPPA